MLGTFQGIPIIAFDALKTSKDKVLAGPKTVSPQPCQPAANEKSEQLKIDLRLAISIKLRDLHPTPWSNVSVLPLKGEGCRSA